MMKFSTLVLSCIIAILSFNGQLKAQSDFIEVGTVLEASLSDGETQQFQWIVLEATLVSIRVEALTGSLDPMIRLIDSSGNVVISNDDYDYPDVKDALIQSFAVTRTDTYTIEVVAFNNTSGDYRLSILPGYDVLVQHDITMNLSNWQTDTQNLIKMTPANERLFIEIEGIAESGYLLAQHFPQHEDFYYQATFREITASTNWQVGIIFRYISPFSFYRLVLNDQGFWRIERVDGEEVVTVQGASTHPAIIPAVPEFTLGILTSGASLNVVYNGQLIGTVYDDALTQSGNVGIVVITANAFNSRVTLMLDEALMTIPTKVGGQLAFPEILTGMNYPSTINILERQQIVPIDGEPKFTSGQNVIRNVEPGVSRFPLVSGIKFEQFVMGGTLSISATGEGVGGCGITFHDVDAENYTLAYVNMAGEYGVSRRSGDLFDVGIYGDSLVINEKYSLIVIVLDDALYLYIDNKHIGTMPYTPLMGEISTAVVNFDGIDTTCTFDDLWLWSFDNITQQ